MIQTQTMKDFYGRIIGYVETDSSTGDKTVRNFYRQIVGYYVKSRDVTTNFYKKVLAKGDVSAALLDFSGK